MYHVLLDEQAKLFEISFTSESKSTFPGVMCAQTKSHPRPTIHHLTLALTQRTHHLPRKYIRWNNAEDKLATASLDSESKNGSVGMFPPPPPQPSRDVATPSLPILRIINPHPTWAWTWPPQSILLNATYDQCSLNRLTLLRLNFLAPSNFFHHPTAQTSGGLCSSSSFKISWNFHRWRFKN